MERGGGGRGRDEGGSEFENNDGRNGPVSGKY